MEETINNIGRQDVYTVPDAEDADEYPAWFDGKKINEVAFCAEFLREHPMICVHENFFSPDGWVSDEDRLKNPIYQAIRPYVTSGVAKKAASLLDAMRIECYAPSLPVYQDRIRLANGTLFLDGTFVTEREVCANRLPVRYVPDAPTPERWLRFLDDLLEPEDIPTLQEYVGYCLIPSTKAQKMLMLTGRGGEGKSRIGLVMRSLLGDSMKTGSISKVETNPFARADLEHQLLMVDDDMKLEALPQTHHIKEIITAECPLDLEKKGRQSYQGTLYVRFLGFGNGTLQSLHDRSVGFFRRQIILTVKEKDENRTDDPFIAEKMCDESEGIFLWALEGLRRLVANNYQFTLSRKALENMRDAVTDSNSIADFLQSEGYVRFQTGHEVSSQRLYAAYRQWCEDNAAVRLSAKNFVAWLKQNAAAYQLSYTNKVRIDNGRYVRGFVGIRLSQAAA